MKFELHQPCTRLAPYIKHFAISESDEAQTYKVLPDTAVVIGFQYRGRLSFMDGGGSHALASAGVTGILDEYRIFSNSASTGSVLVVFKETGAANFLTQPVNELFGQSIGIENLFSRTEISETEEQPATAGTDCERIAVIENFLIKKLNNRPADVLVKNAIRQIYHSAGTIRIANLAQNLYTSQSPLEKRFRTVTGTTPKKFASIVRVRHTLSALEQLRYDRAAYLSGWYDQAHFIKDFKRFTSFTPEQYVCSLRKSGR